MHTTNSPAKLSPCVRLFIELLLREVSEVNSSECSPSVSYRPRRDDIALTVRKAFDTPGPVLIGVHVNSCGNIKLFEDVHEGTVL